MSELTSRLRQLAEASGSLAEVVDTLDERSLPEDMVATAAVQVDALRSHLRQIGELLAQALDPQAATDEYR